MRRVFSLAITVLTAAAWFAPPSLAQDAKTTTAHGIAMHGSTKYGPGFRHFAYRNPDAPKGGNVKLAATGIFDSLNPFVIKGNPASGIGFVYETLLVSSDDEAFSMYGLLAETVTWPEDRSWVQFKLRKDAKWHDGKPVTADDVLFSFETLKTKGRPFYRFYYKAVQKAEKIDDRTVRFIFASGDNKELPLIMGQLPVLPKHFWDGKDFEKSGLEVPLGSGPYRVGKFEPGRFVTYERVKDYWGKDLPVNKGAYNFDTLRYDYYRDTTVAIEALKAGDYDFRVENNSKEWATAYKVPAVEKGLLKKELVDHEIGTGMQGFVFNTRRDTFKDPKVRQALAYLFDFEWSNKNLFYGQYTRTESYFSNSELASSGLPSKAELEILEPLKGKIPEEVFTKEYKAPKYDGSGNIRSGLKTALTILKSAGWTVKQRKLVNVKGEQMKFEVLQNASAPGFQRIILPFVKNMQRLGIDVKLRLVDASQFRERLDNFDFDMVVAGWGQSLSPGNEQLEYWGTEAAGRKGSRNLVGIRDKAIDKLIDKLIAAPDREALITRTRALDRVLLWNHFVIPNWHIRSFRVLYWDKFGRPPKPPKYGLDFNGWWIDAEKAKALAEAAGRKSD